MNPTASRKAVVGQPRKRKDPPGQELAGKPDGRGVNKRPRLTPAIKARNARIVATQTSSKAFKHGELDVDRFVKSREYEIRALEQGLVNSKKALMKRAFQMVPKELRRRTASHNVKRIPKRLRNRGKREMLEDNTPVVSSKTRKPTRHMRLRMETAKKLRALSANRNAAKEKAIQQQLPTAPISDGNGEPAILRAGSQMQTRAPKVKIAVLATPPLAKARYRKRQNNKSWLPSHLFHAKRARMTAPSIPLWNFSIALTPTAKSYRPTHRAVNERGAIAWDMSYMSTILLTGRHASLITVLKSLGVALDTNFFRPSLHRAWENGRRALDVLLHQRELPHNAIAPVTLIWCPENGQRNKESSNGPGIQQRRLLVRVHPSAFLQVWTELLRVCKVAKPTVIVEDLRYEIGSIEIMGPRSTEALVACLWPSTSGTSASTNEVEGASLDNAQLFERLVNLSNPALLPTGAILSLDVQDPRLHHPPRPVKVDSGPDDEMDLLQIVAQWSSHGLPQPSGIFDRKARLAATAALPTQKSINRRRALEQPGHHPRPQSSDPKIPALLYTSPQIHHSNQRSSRWTVLLPWKCITPAWYSVMYVPLSSGMQPRFGGLDETRQISLEQGRPWFPADFPGTQAGMQWELTERRKRKQEWERKPKSKRVNWETLDTGSGEKGEIGVGWACDWERLTHGTQRRSEQDETNTVASGTEAPDEAQAMSADREKLVHLAAEAAQSLLVSKKPSLPDGLAFALVTVRVEHITRGVPQPCARIYRLPSCIEIRKRWLELHPKFQSRRGGTVQRLPRPPKDAPARVMQQRLAQSLLEPLQAGDKDYPQCPGEEDLIGFVTSGNYDLGAGCGMGIGSLLFGKALGDTKKPVATGLIDESRLCVVRNAGLSVGRLAKWDIA